MAYTIAAYSVKPNDVWGSQEVRLVTLKPAASDYATGGYALTPGVGLSLKTVTWALVLNSNGYMTSFNTSTGKLQFFGGAAASGTISIPVGANAGTTGPVYSGAVANTFTTTGTATSITNATFTGTGAGGTGSELAAGTDLSANTFLLLVGGY